MKIYYRLLRKLNIATIAELDAVRQAQLVSFESNSQRINKLVMILRGFERELPQKAREKLQQSLSAEYNSAPIFPYGENAANPQPPKDHT